MHNAATDLLLPEADHAGRLGSGGPAVRVRNISKSYGMVNVLRGVTFDLAPGKIYSIMGPSGCGKSTLLKMMIGVERPNGGSVEIDGINLWEDRTGAASRTSTANLNRARRKFGVLFQSSALLNDLTCGENVALPLRQHTDLSESTIQIMVKMKLEMVGMGHALGRRPNELSGGMKKRCALARAIALDPAIVFYDEPSAGIDPVMISVLDRLIMDLSEKLGITSIVITHEMPSAFRVSDEMLMLWEGRVHFRGTPEQARHSTDPVLRQFIHGEPDGPILRQGSKTALAARVLGIPESELRARHPESERATLIADAAREQALSGRFRRAEIAVLKLNPDTRGSRSGRMPTVAPPALTPPAVDLPGGGSDTAPEKGTSP
jgi:phospholipid/cholesterol/gamma-HCH transport system ATP-binding protein